MLESDNMKLQGDDGNKGRALSAVSFGFPSYGGTDITPRAHSMSKKEAAAVEPILTHAYQRSSNINSVVSPAMELPEDKERVDLLLWVAATLEGSDPAAGGTPIKSEQDSGT